MYIIGISLLNLHELQQYIKYMRPADNSPPSQLKLPQNDVEEGKNSKRFKNRSPFFQKIKQIKKKKISHLDLKLAV